jgi:ATP synthase F0 subunit b
LTAFVIMALVFALVLALKNLFFEPLAQAMETREARIRRAEGAWDEAQKTIQSASQQVSSAVQAARNEGYGLLDEARRGATARARAAVDETRGEAQRKIAEAKASLEAETGRALKSLEAQADELAASLAGRILGRNV